MFNLERDTEMSLELLATAVEEHKKEIAKRLDKLNKMYLSEHDILKQKSKESYKPDNRIVVNFAKYLVDTMNGYFIGNPIKVTSGEDTIDDYIDEINAYNDIDNNNSEIAKYCDIFGRGSEIYYLDEYKQLCTTYVSPLEGFMIYDDSIIERPLFFIRLWKDRLGLEHGSISNSYGVRYFDTDGAYRWVSEWEPHYFGDVPATEFLENDERQGLFEPSITMINEYNKAISEKANDVDYFADAYLKIIGAEVDEATLHKIRDDRTIVISGDEASGVQVEFMVKPSADTTQENLINRLERLIFQISMVANIGDENFGTASGIAMRYKLQGMSNLAKFKERKFSSGLQRRYKLLFSHPTSKVPADSWQLLDFIFTPNIPFNISEEADTAAKLEGIVSKETQLATLSVVKNVSEEIERLKAEEAEKMAEYQEQLAAMTINNQPEEMEPEQEPETDNGADIVEQ